MSENVHKKEGVYNYEGVLAVISGFSGAGKSTLVKKLMEDSGNYSLSVSVTTRQPRKGEEDGKEYFFVTKPQFQDMIERDELLEYAEYVGNYYGTPRAYVEGEMKKGRDVILEIETQGAMQVRSRLENTVLIFITPPSAGELMRRLKGRGTESGEVIMQRFINARKEAELMDSYDYILINDDIDDAARSLDMLIRDQHKRAAAQPALIAEIKRELTENCEMLLK